jgi:hypothetical protein
MQHFLKPAAGTARAGVVATQLLGEFFRAVHHAFAALHARFGGIAFTALTRDFETESRASS